MNSFCIHFQVMLFFLQFRTSKEFSMKKKYFHDNCTFLTQKICIVLLR